MLRRWFARLPEVVDTVSNLVSNAEAIQPAVLEGDVNAFGQCVSNYWSQKKLMAGDGVEPTLITRALAAMAPRLAGYTLAGAGGGGFVLLVEGVPRKQRRWWQAVSMEAPCSLTLGLGPPGGLRQLYL